MWFRIVLTAIILGGSLIGSIMCIDKSTTETRTDVVIKLIIVSFLIYGIWHWL